MIKYLFAILTLAPTMVFAGLRYQDDQAYWEQRWADMYEAQQEAIYEAQIQQRLESIEEYLRENGY
jgi:hypothetical protein